MPVFRIKRRSASSHIKNKMAAQSSPAGVTRDRWPGHDLGSVSPRALNMLIQRWTRWSETLGLFRSNREQAGTRSLRWRLRTYPLYGDILRKSSRGGVWKSYALDVQEKTLGGRLWSDVGGRRICSQRTMVALAGRRPRGHAPRVKGQCALSRRPRRAYKGPSINRRRVARPPRTRRGRALSSMRAFLPPQSHPVHPSFLRRVKRRPHADTTVNNARQETAAVLLPDCLEMR